MPSPYVVKAGDVPQIAHPGANSYPLHSFAGCQTMLNTFCEADYPAAWGVHDDHEGFYVIAGKGAFWLEGEEFEIAPGTAMIAPVGMRHGLKKTSVEDLQVFIFHFSVTKEMLE